MHALQYRTPHCEFPSNGNGFLRPNCGNCTKPTMCYQGPNSVRNCSVLCYNTCCMIDSSILLMCHVHVLCSITDWASYAYSELFS